MSNLRGIYQRRDDSVAAYAILDLPGSRISDDGDRALDKDECKPGRGHSGVVPRSCGINGFYRAALLWAFRVFQGSIGCRAVYNPNSLKCLVSR